jgi:hypothetical protein
VSGSAPASEGRRAYTVMMLAPPGYILPKKMADRAKVVVMHHTMHVSHASHNSLYDNHRKSKWFSRVAPPWVIAI